MTSSRQFADCRAVFEATPGVRLLTDIENRTVAASSDYLELAGLNLSEIVGRDVARLPPYCTSQGDEIEATLRQIGRSMTVDRRAQPRQISNVVFDFRSTHSPFRSRIVPVTGDSGMPTHFIHQFEKASETGPPVSERAAGAISLGPQDLIQTLNDCLAVLADAESASDALRRILAALGKSIGADVGAVWLLDRRERLICESTWSVRPETRDFEAASKAETFACGEGVPGAVWRSLSPLHLETLDDATLPRRFDAACQAGLAQGLAFPVRGTDDFFGVIELFGQTLPRRDNDFRAVFETIGRQTGQLLERLRAERRLRESEAHMAAAQRTARIGSWSLELENLEDLSRNPLFWSEETYRIFGLDPSIPPSNDLFFQMAPVEEREGIEAALADAVKTLSHYSVQHRIRRPDGEIRYVHEEAELLTDPSSGRPRQMTGVVKDITERVLAEQKLRASEDRLRRIFSNAAAGIITTTLDGRCVEANPAFCRIIGASADELRGADLLALLHPEDVSFTVQLWRDLTAGRLDHFTVENRFVGTTGEVVWARASVSLIRDEQGRPQHAVSVVEDVTDRVLADNRLREQRSLLEMASKIGRLGAWSVDVPSLTHRWTDEAREIHELESDYKPTVDELIGFYHNDDRVRMGEAFYGCAQHGVPFDDEFRLITAKGRTIWVRVIGEAVRDERGRIFRVQGAIQDIDEEKAAAMSLADSEERFRQLSESMPLIVWTAEPDGTIDYSNQVFSAYTGIPQSRPPATRWQETLHPEDLDRCLIEWRRCVVQCTPFDIEYRIRRHDGEYRWFRVQAAPGRDTEGRVIKWYGAAIDVDDNKRLQRESTRLVERLRTTLESITDAFYTLDRDWRFTFLNSEAESLLARTREELLGANVWEKFPAAVGTEFQRQYDRAMREGVTASFEDFYPPLNKWFDVRAYPSADGLAVYFRDVTEAKRTREKAEQSERLLSNACRLARLGYWNNDLINQELTWSDELFEIFGLKRRDFDNRLEDFLATLLPEDREMEERVIQNAFATGSPFETNYRIVVDGQIRHIHEIGNVEVDEIGRALRAFGSAQDVTDRVRAEESIRLSEERFRLVAMATNDAVWDWNLVTDDVWWNEGIERLFGFRREQLEPDSRSWTNRIHPDDRKWVIDSIHHAIESGERHWTAEYRFVRADATTAYVLDRGYIIHDRRGRPIQMLGGMTDMTVRREAEEKIRRLNEELEQRVRERTAELEATNKELESFSYSVSHDLRAPLRAIAGFSNILLRDCASIVPDKAKEELELIRTNTEQMGQLIDDLLAFSRLGRQSLRRTPVDVERLVELCLVDLSVECKGRQMDFVVDSLPECEGDWSLLKQVWINLLSNAIKYTRARTSARIEIGAIPGESREVCYFVRDNGVGFDMRYVDKLFGVFQRLHRAEEYEGTGVGLAIVQRIVHRHGGRVWAEGRKGQGASFYFSLGQEN